MTQTGLHWLKALSEAFGPSGCEGDVRKVVLEALASKVDSTDVDHLGNVIALQKGTANAGFKVITPIEIFWWLIIFPAVALGLTLFSLNFLGDGLRDALDPRMKNQS